MPYSRKILPHGKKSINAQSPNYYTATGTLGEDNILTGTTNSGSKSWTADLSSLSGGGGTPGGSTTQIQYNNAGAFAGTSAMTYDSSSEKLVLTSTQAGNASLQLKNTQAASTASGLEIYNQSSQVFQIGHNNNTDENYVWGTGDIPLKFATSGTERMRISATGNIGIGTALPTQTLDVRGNTFISGTLYMENGWELDGTSTSNFELDNGGTLKYRFSNGRFQTVHAGTEAAPTLTDNNDTTTGIYYPGTADWAVSTSGTTALYIADDQKVGIGTTAPGAQLHVSGTSTKLFQVNSGSSSMIQVSGNRIGFGPTGTNTGAMVHIDNTLNGGGYALRTLAGGIDIAGAQPLSWGSGDQRIYSTMGSGKRLMEMSIYDFADEWYAISVQGGTGSAADHRVGINTRTPLSGNNNAILDVSGSQRLYGSLELVSGATTSSAINSLWASGTTLMWKDKEVYTNTPGTSEITGGGSSGQMTYFDGSSSVTGSANLTFDGTRFSSHVKIADDKKLLLGNSSDLQLYHSAGASSYFTNGTNALIIWNQDSAAGTLKLRNDREDYGIQFDVSGTEVGRFTRVGGAGRLGLGGVTAPAYTLDVGGAIHTNQDYYLKRTGGAFYYQNNAGTNLWALYETDGKLAVYDYQGGGAQMMTFNSGNVGIGTTSPGALLHIDSDTTGDIEVLRLENSNASTTSIDSVTQSFRLRRDQDDYSYHAGKITAVKEQGWTNSSATVDASLIFSTIQNETTSEKMRITSAGNVGIGTIPSKKFQVKDTNTNDALLSVYNDTNGIVISGSGANGMYLYANDFIRFYTRTKFNADLMFDNNTSKLKFKTADNYIYTPTTNDLEYNAQNQHNFLLSGTSIMTLSGAKVGIGITEPTSKLHVKGTLDIQDGNQTILMGAGNSSTSRSDDTLKLARVGLAHYHNAEEPVAMLYASSNGTDNTVVMGGGTSNMNAATKLQFATAENDATTAGTVRASIQGDSNYDKLFLGADTTLGLYRYSNRMDFYISSNPRMHLDASKLYSATSGGPLLDLTPTAGEANYGFYGDTDTGMSRSAANTLHLLTAGVSGMTLISGGKVGIGTTAPRDYLEVASSADDDPAIRLTNSRTGTSGSLMIQHRGSSINIKADESNPMRFSMGSTEKMRITSSGTGIGTVAPTNGNALTIAGTMDVSNNIDVANRVRKSATQFLDFSNTSTGLTLSGYPSFRPGYSGNAAGNGQDIGTSDYPWDKVYSQGLTLDNQTGGDDSPGAKTIWVSGSDVYWGTSKLNAQGGGGGIGGSIANTQVAYGNGTDITGSANLIFDGTNLNPKDHLLMENDKYIKFYQNGGSTYHTSIGYNSSNELQLGGLYGVKLRTYSGGWGNRVTVASDGKVGIGNESAIGNGRLTVLDASNPQLSLAYDGSNYNTLRTKGDGALEIKRNGTAASDRIALLSGTNILIGQYAGYDIDSDQTGETVIIGDRAGFELKGNETHGRHTIIGAQAAYTVSGTTDSDYIVAIGAYSAGYAQPTKGFTAIGAFSGYYLSGSGDAPLLIGGGAGKGAALGAWGTSNGVTMNEDVLIGHGGVGEYAETLSQNTIVGSRAAGYLRTGTQNVAIGRFALRNASGSNGVTGNVTIGQSAGAGIGQFNKTNGSRYNIAIGYETQEKNLVGDRNIAIGYKVGIDGADTADDILRIGNAAGDYSFIRGDMANNNLWIGAGTPKFTLSGGKVGIGTVAPEKTLHVKSAGTSGVKIQTSDASSYAQLQFTSPNTGYSLINFGDGEASSPGYIQYTHSSDLMLLKATKTIELKGASAAGYINFSTDNTERMRIKGDGNVGIGITNPSMPLHVSGNDHEVVKIEGDHSAGASLKIDATAAGGTNWKFQSTASGSGHGAGKLSIQEDGTNRVAIIGGGKVGIGTTSPDQYLHVKAGTTDQALKLESTDGNVDATFTDSAGSGIIRFTDDRFEFYTDSGYSNNPINFWDDKVGIGTQVPATKLDVIGDGSAWPIAKLSGSNSHGTGLQLFNSNTTQQDWAIVGGGASHNYSFRVYDQTDSLYRFAIDRDGGVGIGGTNAQIVSPSDRLTVIGETNASVQLGMYAHSATDDKTAKIFLNKSANSTVGSHSAVADNDVLGLIGFRGSDGDSYELGAQIRGQATQDFAAGARGTDLIFSTVDNSTTTLDDRMVITQDGKVGIGLTNPSEFVHIKHASTNSLLLLESGDNIASLRIKDPSSTQFINSDGGYLSMGTNSSLNAGNLNVSSDGWTGVGTVAPKSKLHVSGGSFQKAVHTATYIYDIAAGFVQAAILEPNTGNFIMVAPEPGQPAAGATIPTYLPDSSADTVGLELTIINNTSANPGAALAVQPAAGSSDSIYEGGSNSASATVSIAANRGANKTFINVATNVWVVKD